MSTLRSVRVVTSKLKSALSLRYQESFKPNPTAAAEARHIAHEEDIAHSAQVKVAAHPIEQRLFAKYSLIHGHQQQNAKASSWRFIVYPGSKRYFYWWLLTVFFALATGLVIPFNLAFGVAPGLSARLNVIGWFEVMACLVFLLDILVNFRRAYYENEFVIVDTKLIAQRYLRGTFFIDVLGAIPLDILILAISGEWNQDTKISRAMALLQLVRLVRLYRDWHLFVYLQYNVAVSLLFATFIRNIVIMILNLHWGACGYYYIAREYSFGEDTWVGNEAEDLITSHVLQRYIYSVYWAMQTCTTVGYGDISPKNTAEVTWATLFMWVNIALMAYMMGNITLLVLKWDEMTGRYRELVGTLHEFTYRHQIPGELKEQMEEHLRLHFNNHDLEDESVLSSFPQSFRKRINRHLYMNKLEKCYLFQGCSQKFFDTLLAAARVEMFTPRWQLLNAGDHVEELIIIVGGVAEVRYPADIVDDAIDEYLQEDDREKERHPTPEWKTIRGRLAPGDPCGEIAFFGETLQLDEIRTWTTCRVLTISADKYQEIAAEHTNSAHMVLSNLLTRMEMLAQGKRTDTFGRSMSNNSLFQMTKSDAYSLLEPTSDMAVKVVQVEAQRNIRQIKELMHTFEAKQNEIKAARLLFSACEGNMPGVLKLINNGIEVDTVDAHGQTALMLASMKGHVDVVNLLLQFGANANKVDDRQHSALLEACLNRNRQVVKLLVAHGGSLASLPELKTAELLCTAVAQHDAPLIEILLSAGACANSANYDGRTALHVSAAKGNVVAVQLLISNGQGDLKKRDNAGVTPMDEARRLGLPQLLQLMERFEKRK